MAAAVAVSQKKRKKKLVALKPKKALVRQNQKKVLAQQSLKKRSQAAANS